MSPEYLAGFLDAEGNFTVAGTSALVRVTSTHRPTLEAIAAKWGGSVGVHSEHSDRCRRCFVWRAYGETALAVLEAVLPHLVEKRMQALVLREWSTTGSSDPLRAWIKTQLSALKRLEHPA